MVKSCNFTDCPHWDYWFIIVKSDEEGKDYGGS